ncbi:protein translocase subunit SecF [candidate division FCPU426 bacterium]|nr:protein translocase subunit SecF [candidate division FCPU426 bacterium]
MLQLIHGTHFDFMKIRRLALGLSGLMVAVGIFAMVQIVRGQANMGVDFSGGTSMEVEFAKEVGAEKLRDALNQPEFQNVSQQFIREPGRYKYMLRVFAPKLPTESVSTRVLEVLKEKIAGNEVELLSSEDVGPTVSAHLRQQALYAIFWSVVAILLYIWWRFDFRFAVAATIATFHDVIVVLGIFWFMQYEVSWILITALLTLAGYSLNDTIVVFDRIRENMRHRRKDAFIQIANDSINETLSRTIITGGTTLLVVIALLFLGGEVIHAFSLAMFLGIIIGTYSSIFVASAIMSEWHLRDPLPR